MRKIIWKMMCLMPFLLTLVAFSASADPVGFPVNLQDTSFRFSNPFSGYIWVVAVNFAVNLFLFSLFIWIAILKWDKKIGSVTPFRREFFFQLISAALVITLIGALIDLVFLTRQENNGFYYLYFDATNWAAASALIYFSILAPAFILMRIRIIPTIVIAASMAIMNPIWWVMVGQLGEIVTFGTLLVSLLFVWLPVSKLLDWHSKSFMEVANPQKQ